MNAIELQGERFAGDLKRLVQDSEAMLEARAEVVGDKACKVRARLREALDLAARNCHALEQRTVRSAKTADKLVRQHPYESVCVALGIGFLVAFLTGRK
jgi:ElaB/YqjD/DUF883 family membrane-anchored ribosome-binding protein